MSEMRLVGEVRDREIDDVSLGSRVGANGYGNVASLVLRLFRAMVITYEFIRSCSFVRISTYVRCEIKRILPCSSFKKELILQKSALRTGVVAANAAAAVT